MEGVAINDDTVLEREADGMGTKAITSSVVLQKNANQTYANDHLRSNIESLSGVARSVQSPIQLVVSKCGLRSSPGFFSDETELTYTNEETAKREDREAREKREAAEKAERPHIDFNFQQPKEGPPVPETPLASELLQHSRHFGPVMTRGGDVKATQVQALAQVHEPVPSPDRPTAFTGRNTYAAVLSSAEDVFKVHRIEGNPEDLSSLEGIDPSKFREEFIFMQGPPPVGVQLGPKRKRAHAEALATHSDAFLSAVEENATDLMELSEACGFDPDVKVKEEPTDKQIGNLCTFLGTPPVRTTIVTNRAMCGVRGGSGYKGGCTKEIADTASKYEEEFAKNMVPYQWLAKLALKTRMAIFGVSVAGDYKNQGNPSIMAESGVDVDVHNPFDWSTGQGKPISKEQQKYLFRADRQKSEERERDREHRSSARTTISAAAEEETLPMKITKFEPEEIVCAAPQGGSAEAFSEEEGEKSKKSKVEHIYEYLRNKVTDRPKSVKEFFESHEKWEKDDELVDEAIKLILQ